MSIEEKIDAVNKKSLIWYPYHIYIESIPYLCRMEDAHLQPKLWKWKPGEEEKRKTERTVDKCHHEDYE